MTLAKLYRGPRSKIDEKSFEEGSVYFTTDTHEILVDIPDTTEHQVYGGQPDNFVEITTAEVDAIFEKHPFSYEDKENPGSSEANIDKDELYAYVLKKMLNDPAAIFQGASATSEGLVGLVPAIPENLQ